VLIILEGPDGSGKTHLARDLEELILRALPGDSVTISHSGPPGDHPLDEYERSLTWYRPGQGTHLILDRWHWGEYVYPAVEGRPTKFNFVQEWHVENYLKRLGAIVVQTTQYADQYRRVYAERNELHDAAILPAVKLHYREIRKRTHLPVIDWNWMSPIWGDLHRVIEEADKQEKLYMELNKFTTYVGPRRCDFLLFGDDRAIRRQGEDYAKPVLIGRESNLDPAFMPFGNTSGDFLIGAFLNGGTGNGFNVGLANACDVDDPYQLWLAVGQPQVVALGRNAKKKINESGKIGFWARGVVPHPQYVRRFHHGDQWAYGQNIRMAARHGGDYSKWHEQLRDERARMSTARSSKMSDDAVGAASPATA
jgi:thymidylate kinase